MSVDLTEHLRRCYGQNQQLHFTRQRQVSVQWLDDLPELDLGNPYGQRTDLSHDLLLARSHLRGERHFPVIHSSDDVCERGLYLRRPSDPLLHL